MTTLGKYTLHESLGHGGFASVYRATHNTLDTEAAIKVLNPSLVKDEKVRQRFTREAQTASNLEHPHIVRITNLVETDEQVYIVMEYLPGGDLNRWRKEHGPLSRADLLRILEQIAGALDYAHGKGVLHRDVKPGNILIDAEGRAKLSDFGLVRPPDAPHLTQLGSVVGTATYISPEQAEARQKIDGRADQYSLAVVAYELFAGQPPFQGEHSTAITLMHVTKPPPVPSSLNVEIPPEADAALLKALGKQPEERYASCTAFVQALEAALQDSNLRRFRELLAEGRALLQESKYAEVRQCLDIARTLIGNLPEQRDALTELEKARWQAENYEQCVKEWQTAQDKAQTVLDLLPDYPDTQQVFETLGLRKAPRRLPPVREIAAQIGFGFLLGIPLAALALYGALRWILSR